MISDSGGLQEEVPSFGKTILITRLTTERPEVLASGHGILVGFDKELLLDETLKALYSDKSILSEQNPFGDGQSSRRIAQTLIEQVQQLEIE